MKPIDRQKMCPNCDGRIPFDAPQCPYCFTPTPVEPKSDSFSALYTPPSKPVAESVAAPAEKTENPETSAFLPLLMLTLAGNLLTVGLLQFFFSDHGVVRLEMNGSYWFLMVLVSIPLFYYGFKKVSS